VLKQKNTNLLPRAHTHALTHTHARTHTKLKLTNIYNYAHGNLLYSLYDIFILTYGIDIHKTKQTSQIRPFISSTE